MACRASRVREASSNLVGGRRIRCAIYTRKSSEEGLEQEFNSLDAQREACEAFVRSQRHEGWIILPQLYDDAGYSGGTMERPALKRLLADITAHRIDAVVVYKVDRLTRSLADFAKIVEVFDAHGVSFVSITQAFNTTTSMGRLTLNVLLSFAQFEREVTGERIRDKIAASKKKGLWMGGQPSLGYDVKDRKLIVHKAEATTVRMIFRRYLELGSVWALKAALDEEGVASKLRTAADGGAYGGKSFSRGALYLMLQNRIYRGEIVHNGTAYSGEHASIIDADLWSSVKTPDHLELLEKQRSYTFRTSGRGLSENRRPGGTPSPPNDWSRTACDHTALRRASSDLNAGATAGDGKTIERRIHTSRPGGGSARCSASRAPAPRRSFFQPTPSSTHLQRTTPSHLSPNPPCASRCGDDHVAERGRRGLTIPESLTLRARGIAT